MSDNNQSRGDEAKDLAARPVEYSIRDVVSGAYYAGGYRYTNVYAEASRYASSDAAYAALGEIDERATVVTDRLLEVVSTDRRNCARGDEAKALAARIVDFLDYTGADISVMTVATCLVAGTMARVAGIPREAILACVGDAFDDASSGPAETKRED